jgi:integrase
MTDADEVRYPLEYPQIASGPPARGARKASGPGKRRRKRRTRSPHPGVVLIPPDRGGRHLTWRARFRDPDTGKLTKTRLDPSELSTEEGRREWAIRKSKALAKRRMDLEAGAPRATGTKLSDAVDRYFKAHAQLRPRTRAIYRSAADKLLAWAGRAGVETADGLTRAQLLAFRETLVRAPKRAPVVGGKRGVHRSTGGPRTPRAVNHDLGAVRTVLGYLRDLDLLPRLSDSDLRRALKRLSTTSERLDYLKPQQCQKLLEAALRHDAKTLVFNREEEQEQRRIARRQRLTRKEQAERVPSGTTPRYEPIAPFIAFVLLTGCRLGEALALDWKQVDLDALDHEGRKVGEVHLAGAGTKTRIARTVGLEVSPALKKLLAAMHLAGGGKGSVFRLSKGAAEAAAKRLRSEYGAPEAFTWQALRRTCGTFLTNAPGIFGAASAYRSAKQLGHSVQIAEKHYLGLVRGIPRDARTVEAAMQLEDLAGKAIAGVSSPRPSARAVSTSPRRVRVPVLALGAKSSHTISQ